MVTRLSTSDASFYRLEDTATPMYVGSLSILRRPRAGLSYEALLATIEQVLRTGRQTKAEEQRQRDSRPAAGSKPVGGHRVIIWRLGPQPPAQCRS